VVPQSVACRIVGVNSAAEFGGVEVGVVFEVEGVFEIAVEVEVEVEVALGFDMPPLGPCVPIGRSHCLARQCRFAGVRQCRTNSLLHRCRLCGAENGSEMKLV
jgi:hypothetical protein